MENIYIGISAQSYPFNERYNIRMLVERRLGLTAKVVGYYEEYTIFKIESSCPNDELMVRILLGDRKFMSNQHLNEYMSRWK